jgi:hypothetical protein
MLLTYAIDSHKILKRKPVGLNFKTSTKLHATLPAGLCVAGIGYIERQHHLLR